MLSLILANIRYIFLAITFLVAVWFMNSYINLRINSAIDILEDEMNATRLEMEKVAREYEYAMKKIEATVTMENASEESVRREIFNQNIETLNKTKDSVPAGPAMKSALETLKGIRK